MAWRWVNSAERRAWMAIPEKIIFHETDRQQLFDGCFQQVDLEPHKECNYHHHYVTEVVDHLKSEVQNNLDESDGGIFFVCVWMSSTAHNGKDSLTMRRPPRRRWCNEHFELEEALHQESRSSDRESVKSACEDLWWERGPRLGWALLPGSIDCQCVVHSGSEYSPIKLTSTIVFQWFSIFTTIITRISLTLSYHPGLTSHGHQFHIDPTRKSC